MAENIRTLADMAKKAYGETKPTGGNLLHGVKAAAGKAVGVLGAVAHAPLEGAKKAGDVLGGAGHLGAEGARRLGSGVGGVARLPGDVLGGAAHLGAEGARGVGRGLKRGTETINGEAILSMAGLVLEHSRVYGRAVTDFAVHKGAVMGGRYASRELAKYLLGWSGIAGVGVGGVSGTIIAGSLAGAFTGAVVEYSRQVHKNVKEGAGTGMAPGKLAFLRRTAAVMAPSDYAKIGRAAVVGGLGGFVAQELIQNIPGLGEFVREHTEGLRSMLGGVPGVGEAKDMASQLPGVEGTKEALGGAWGAVSNADNYPGVQGVKDIINPDIPLPGEEGVKGVWGAVSDVEHYPGAEGTKEFLGGAKDAAGDLLNRTNDIPGAQGTKDVVGGVWGAVSDIEHYPGAQGAKDLANAIPGVQGIKDAAGGVWNGIDETLDSGHDAGGQLGDVDQGAQAGGETGVTAGGEDSSGGAAQGAGELPGQTGGEATPAPKGFVPQADLDQAKGQLDAANRQITELQKQLAEAKALAGTGAVVPPADAMAAAVGQAQVALSNFGDSIPLPAGSNPWETSTTILKQMGVKPTLEQIMQLDKVICQENSLSIPEWGIEGKIDARNIPAGFKINLTDAVKKTALAIASKK